jgi:hypothetical protein
MAQDDFDAEFKLKAFRWFEQMGEREFVDTLTEILGSAAEKSAGKTKKHLVLAEVEESEPDWWTNFVVALPHPEMPVGKGAKLDRFGHCGECSTEIKSWGAVAICPVCGAEVQTDMDADKPDVHSGMDLREGGGNDSESAN